MSVSENTFDHHDNHANNTISPSSSSKRRRRLATRSFDHSKHVAFFQICQSCLWCASTLYEEATFTNCPSCKSDSMSSLPISPNEIYSYYHHDGDAGANHDFKSMN